MSLMMCTNIILFIMTRQMRIVGEYDTYIGEEACIQVFGWETWKEATWKT